MTTDIDLLRIEGSVPRRVSKPFRVIGIDLGTTNSSVAEIEWHPDSVRRPQVRRLEIDQETFSGRYTHVLVPSVVALSQGRESVGQEAKMLRSRAVENGLEPLRDLFSECKNDIGTRRTYHKAPEGYRSASDIAARVLAFLIDAAKGEGDLPILHTVVTVPASFQAAQRTDTVKAAGKASLALSGGDLLDEPIAALLAWLLSTPDPLGGNLDRGGNIVVFDFGGGTCDVAVLRVGSELAGAGARITALAVSRYHRLGGGDLDRAIVHDVLLPQLLEQNGIEPRVLSFEEKKHFVEPALLDIGEALKIGLCNEIERLTRFGQYATTDKTLVVKTQPGAHMVRLPDRVLELKSPTLSAAQFEALLAPFLDTDLLYARETEYRLTCSIFAPLQDALDRAGLSVDAIDDCLLVGGSCLIPQVRDAVGAWLPNAKLLEFPDHDATQSAVAEGAAVHALMLALYGRGAFQLSCRDRVSIRTNQGSIELIPANAAIPYPGQGAWASTTQLVVPETSITSPVSLRVEILAGPESDARALLVTTWDIAPPVNRGERLLLKYRLDENQVLELELKLDVQPGAEPFVARIENPLTNVVNPNTTRLRIEESEEKLRTGQVAKERVPDVVVDVARDYSQLRQHEKAISYLKRALRMKNAPNPYILNLLGIYYGEVRDHANEQKFYREAHAAAGESTPLFNLALSHLRHRELAPARDAIVTCLQVERRGPYLVLAAQIAEALGDQSQRDQNLRDSLTAFGDLRSMDDWELGWCITGARMIGDQDRVAKTAAELHRRSTSGPAQPPSRGVLPDMAADLIRPDAPR